MVARAIERFIDVQITKEAPLVSAAAFGKCLVITNSVLLTTTSRVKIFTTLAEVGEFFGTSSEEYNAADAYFNQDPFLANKPEDLYFGRYANAATAAVLECGNAPLTTIATWQAIIDGTLSITIDGGVVDLTGLNFATATSLDDVATIIDTALAANGDCYYIGGRFNFNSPTTGATSLITLLSDEGTGTDISGTGFLDGDTAKSATVPGGSILSQGQIAESFTTAIAAIENVNNDWYAMSAVRAFRDVSDTESMADAIESRRKMFLIATNDSNTLTSGDTSSFSYYLKNANYSRSSCIYHDNVGLYPDMSWLGQQLPKDVGSTNWAYKTLAGIAEGAASNIDPVSLTEAQKNAALSVNCNIYTTILGVDSTYFGTMGGGRNADKEGEYIDIIRNIDFLQARVEEGLFSLLVEKEIVPYTNGGISTVDNRLKSLLDTYGVKQGILTQGTVETSFPKRSETTSANREDRLLPSGTFTGALQGGINKVVVRGTVYV
jgi:hypothetical protein